jgi:hypothetical protein
MHRCNRRMAAGLILVGLGLTGCGIATSTYGEVSQGGPAQVERISGTSLNRVTLTPQAAERLGIKTVPAGADVVQVGRDGTAASGHITVPVSALIYDKDGAAWVYTTWQPLAYQRESISVARIDGDTAVLTSGPALGTAVVTVGAAELLGAELGVAGE